MSIVKDKMIEVIKQQPEDSNFEEILKELSFLKMVENGLNDSRNNNITSTSALKEQIKKW